MQPPSSPGVPTVREILGRMDMAALLDPAELATLADAMRSAGADEGTVWLLDAGANLLTAVHNNGPDAGLIEGFRQPVGSGLISMVLETEQTFCENDVPTNATQDKRLDQLVGKDTVAMIAVPWHVRGECCGVVSCVKLEGSADHGGFTGHDVDRVEAAVGRLQSSMEKAILRFNP